ncbi:MAG: hypothetical protein M0Z95_11205 [Actinomycetota bacterium]|jgi:uncharacterized protein (DUF697 family)|nr:hypothetical protein [Actinomycetota bacterium]
MITEMARFHLRLGLAVLVLALLMRLTKLPGPDLVADDLAVIVSAVLVVSAGFVRRRHVRHEKGHT